MACPDFHEIAAICGELREMNTLKVICLTIIQLIKQAWLLPQSVAIAAKQRRRRTVLNGLEAERLDRIRNPSKYIGK